MRNVPVNVSPSTLTFNCLFLLPTYPSTFSEMENAKKRATIRLQATKKKETGDSAMGMGSSKLSAKKKPCTQEAEDFLGARPWSNG